jgi:hypothetical protein
MVSTDILGFWKKYIGEGKKMHSELFDVFSNKRLAGEGIYFIGCADRIVYIGQSINLKTRAIESLGQKYQIVNDESLPWAIGFTPLKDYQSLDINRSNYWEETYGLMNELESTAVRKFAPKFNTYLHSHKRSEGKEPDIKYVAQVFANNSNCTAFDSINVRQQKEEALKNECPPWKNVKKRRKRNPVTGELE